MTSHNIIVGLSGGVDSSVAAYRLLGDGHQVSGLFMKNWEEDDDEKYCSATVDLEDATQIADNLNITLHTRNFSGEYWQNVFEHFVQEYKVGRTPNPDVICNREIKFKTFLQHALALGADFIATGHYARIENSDGRFKLMKAVDENKDQSYFLYLLNQYQLSKSLFPLGELAKPEVRKIAERNNFQNYAKKDSTGICFIGERKFKDFLSRFLPSKPGNICTTDGNVIGQHHGALFYTLGQRQGLGIGGQSNASGEPWYVIGKDVENNIVYAGQGVNQPALFSDTLKATSLHWISDQPPTTPFTCHAKTRYRQPDQVCKITQLSQGNGIVQFDQPQRAVTPGQSVVFYQGDECLGGGIIDSTSISQ